MSRQWRNGRDRAESADASSAEELAARQRVPGTWIEEQVAAASALEGREIQAWLGVEDFIRSNEDETVFEFDDPNAPCLYLAVVEIQMVADPTVRIGTYYDNWDGWGLTLEPYDGRLEALDSPGSRTRRLSELPVGRVESVKARIDEIGNLAEIEMAVGDRFLLLAAGEIHPTWTERLEFVRGDESVLVFASQADYESIEWRNPWPDGMRA